MALLSKRTEVPTNGLLSANPAASVNASRLADSRPCCPPPPQGNVRTLAAQTDPAVLLQQTAPSWAATLGGRGPVDGFDRQVVAGRPSRGRAPRGPPLPAPSAVQFGSMTVQLVW